jgi:hypothetical protein
VKLVAGEKTSALTVVELQVITDEFKFIALTREPVEAICVQITL